MNESSPPWNMLSKKAKNVFVTLGTRSQEAIGKIKTQHLIDAIREAKMFGYDENGPYKMLEYEIEHRDRGKRWRLGVIAVVVTVIGVLASIYFK